MDVSRALLFALGYLPMIGKLKNDLDRQGDSLGKLVFNLGTGGWDCRDKLSDGVKLMFESNLR